MARWQKVLDHVLGGQSDANIPFVDLTGLLDRLGYRERIRGDHHIFSIPGQPHLIDIQPLKDGKAKAYQVSQVRDILHYRGITRMP